MKLEVEKSIEEVVAGSVDEILSRAESTFAKFEQGNEVDYISEAVILDRQALDRCPPGHHKRWDSLNQLANHLSHRYDCLGTIADIEEAIVCSREVALELCPDGHPLRSTCLFNVAFYLSDRYKRLGDMMDLEEAIILGRQALDFRPPGHPDRSASLHNVALYVADRYRRLGDMTELNEAIILGKQALDLHPSGHPLRPTSLNNVANRLSDRYNQLGDVTDLNEAITLGRQALDLHPSGHPDRTTSLNNVASYLFNRYKLLGDTSDLEEAIILGRQTLDLRPPGHPDRPASLHNVALYVSDRYRWLGDMTELNEAIILGKQALDLHPLGHPLRPTSLNNVANCLSDRYNQLGDVTDLNEAITLGRQALDLRPLGHPDRPMSLDNVALHLSYRYQQLGNMTDLNEAIILGRKALDLQPSGHPDRSSSLNNVANYLSDRYNQLGDMADLNEAIILGRQALDLRPPGHPHHSMSLNNVANYFSIRYTCLGDLTDLNEAIILGRQALELRPAGHPDRSASLNNVGVFLSDRYNQLGDVTDLNEAIILGRQALDLRPLGHPRRSMSLNNVANCLSDRYELLGDVMDLNEAIILGRQALELNPSGHPNISLSLIDLAGHLRVQFTQTRELKDSEDVFSLSSELTNIPQTVSPLDLSAAKEWISVAEDFGHPTTLLAYETSLRLLVQHLAALPSLPNHLQIFKELALSLAVDSFSVCLRNQRANKAIELLEQGRGVFWSQITALRSPLEDVIASGQEGKSLADELTRLSSEIRNTIHSQGPDQHNRLCDLNLDLESAIMTIRKSPGLARFLLPSSFSELQHAASGGPVIIVNASKYMCDAVVVFFDRDPVHIPLQITKQRVQDMSSELRSLTSRAKLVDVNNDLGRFLRDLWDEIVSPIVDFLQTTVPPHSRIWWCPTAEFSLLPLHAAGSYRAGRQNLSRLYISSYTPTLTALIRARRNVALAESSINKNRFLAVGQAAPNGQSKLLSVDSELDIVSECIQGLATFTRLEGSESSISRVEEELRKNEWVHFACHGVPNEQRPFKSAFSLHDGPFTVERIMGCELEHPEFAYLSACHTTVGYKDGPDEVIRLASAMQFAGFRSVIGSMWAVDDAHTKEITTKLYENMLDGSGRLGHTRAAFALNKTMDSLGSKIPLDQRISYIHVGA